MSRTEEERRLLGDRKWIAENHVGKASFKKLNTITQQYILLSADWILYEVIHNIVTYMKDFLYNSTFFTPRIVIWFVAITYLKR
jgi:hypothetical protein